MSFYDALGTNKGGLIISTKFSLRSWGELKKVFTNINFIVTKILRYFIETTKLSLYKRFLLVQL